MKKIVLITLACLPLLTAACNTMAGAGEDVSHAGHEITGEANEHR
ncbi:MAG TPA: entericidin A/B family lipoprotein [Patescibacteria group bacterium]|jgi:predicted small secreted protein|nr:entericidin A/B family lipoprotein [Patescibacteria group bacterium]